MINIKADRVKQGARKVYHGRYGARGCRVGQACFKVLYITYICFKSEKLAFYTINNTHDLPPNVNICQWKGGNSRISRVNV
jgi:hypothetical protein